MTVFVPLLNIPHGEHLSERRWAILDVKPLLSLTRTPCNLPTGFTLK